MNIKQLLSETMPEDVTLSEREKTAIRQRIHVNKKPSIYRFLAPVAAASVLLLALVLFLPTLTQNPQPAFEIERSVALPDIPYDSLISSTYIEQNDELIYPTNDGIYRYSFEDRLTEKLFDTSEKIYEYATSDKWLIWVETGEDTSVLHIVNRETEKQNMLKGGSWLTPTLQGDRLLYLSMRNNEQPSYWLMDLATLDESILHRRTEEYSGSSSQPSRGDGMTVISERVEDATTLFVYSDETGELLHSFPSPYAAIHRLQVADGRIYGDFASEEEHMRFGYLTFETGEFTELDAPTYWNSAVIGDYVALDLPSKHGVDQSDVELFKIQGQELVPVSNFPSIKERLVIPHTFRGDFDFLIEENFISGGPTLHFIRP